jgi:hypothetical protein
MKRAIVSAGHEHLEPGSRHRTDEEWIGQIVPSPADVPWLEPVLGPR